jgi:hypothetical protein
MAAQQGKLPDPSFAEPTKPELTKEQTLDYLKKTQAQALV